VVHFYSLILLPLGLLPLVVAKLRGARVVLTVHDPVPHRWRFPQSLRWLEKGLFNAAYKWSDCLIVYNDAAKDALTRAVPQKAQQVRVIPHTAYAASPSSEYPSFACLRLLLFGSIRRNKGVDLAIKALHQLRAVTPVPVRLTIAGSAQNSAEQEYWSWCKELIVDWKDSKEVEVIDRYIGEEEIAPLMSQHHAVLLPYVDFFSESGVANLSLSHARPVLATVAGGLADLLERAKCGIPIHAATPDSVVEAIVRACHLGHDELRQLGVNGRDFLSRERSLISISRQTAKLYSELSPALNGDSVAA
jgi:glycosyltransferase involved in cell wall biosynthesis